MKVLIVDTYYPAFLNSFYAKNPGLSHQPYEDQWRALMDQCFGTSDYYSTNLRQLGHEAMEVVANCKPLQLQWAREHGISLRYKLQQRSYHWISLPLLAKDWLYPILLDQVKAYTPDVIHFQDPAGMAPTLLQEIRPYVQLITGQIASPIGPQADFREYDLVLSSLPHYVQRFCEQGLKSRLFRLGFERTILEKLIKESDPYSVVHIGGYGPVHRERNELLEVLILHNIPMACWGYGIDRLPPASPIHGCYQGTAWGLEMYNIRYNSKIVVSRHVSSVADVYANIMTLYEATGVGALLVIDQRKDLHMLFEPGNEVVAYSSSDECIELIRYYLEHDEERESIARVGQQRTLRDHTYYHRMEEFIELVKPLLA